VTLKINTVEVVLEWGLEKMNRRSGRETTPAHLNDPNRSNEDESASLRCSIAMVGVGVGVKVYKL